MHTPLFIIIIYTAWIKNKLDSISLWHEKCLWKIKVLDDFDDNVKNFYWLKMF